MVDRSLQSRIVNYIWHGFVILLSFASLIEAIFGVFPIPSEHESSAKSLFLGLTLIGAFYEIANRLLSSYYKKNNLLEMVENGLILCKDNRVESSVLLEIESDLDAAFNTRKGSYHIIIVTACLNPNEEAYINAIWKNINNGVRYLYVTPESDQEFINSIISIFLQKGYDKKIPNVYRKIVDNISHISYSEVFDILPECFDLCLYCKDQNGHISAEGAKGFCSYQDELIHLNGRSFSFYYPLSTQGIGRVFNRFSNEYDKEHILQPFISTKIEKKNSPIHGQGLYCKANETFKKGEVAMIKGGYELHRSEMSTSEIIDSYLPIGDDLFLAAKTVEEEQCVKLYINHSCSPNIGMLDERTFIAIRNIKGGEELTIDYAFVDNENYTFSCHCGSRQCRHTINGTDWKIKAIQQKYRKYFSPYLKSKISSL